MHEYCEQQVPPPPGAAFNRDHSHCFHFPRNMPIIITIITLHEGIQSQGWLIFALLCYHTMVDE